MATFMAVTSSSSARLRDVEAVRKLLDRYSWDGDVEAKITEMPHGQAHLTICGYDWPSMSRIPEAAEPASFEDNDDNEFEKFLLEIAPHLAEPLTVQAVGSEKCRSPLCACEWHVVPGGNTLQVNAFRYPEAKDDPDRGDAAERR
jgi:hypothetical protein